LLIFVERSLENGKASYQEEEDVTFL